MTDTVVNIQSINPAGTSINFALWGDAVYEPAGSGGWQIVDRPRLVGATQWFDRAPMQLQLPLVIDSRTLFGNDTTSIEPYCLTVDQWQSKVPGTQQPPVFAISGPVPGIQHQWVMQKVAFNEAIRDSQVGYRVQQKISMTLYEYNSPLYTVMGSPTPAQLANDWLAVAESAQSYVLYTVGAGDNLATIASALLNNYARWPEIAQLNSIRDPNNISVGQVLKIPQF